jgi:hypothetical protein
VRIDKLVAHRGATIAEAHHETASDAMTEDHARTTAGHKVNEALVMTNDRAMIEVLKTNAPEKTTADLVTTEARVKIIAGTNAMIAADHHDAMTEAPRTIAGPERTTEAPHATIIEATTTAEINATIVVHKMSAALRMINDLATTTAAMRIEGPAATIEDLIIEAHKDATIEAREKTTEVRKMSEALVMIVVHRTNVLGMTIAAMTTEETNAMIAADHHAPGPIRQKKTKSSA